MENIFFDLAEKYRNPQTAKTVIVPIPFEKTVSYGGGAGNGPMAILSASQQVEFFDEVLGLEPREAGIIAEPLEDPETLSRLSAPAVINRFETLVGSHLDAGRFPIVLGGEHTVTLAPFFASRKRHPNLKVLFLDAHADLREKYHDDLYSHACVARRMADHARLVEVGIRSYDREQAEAMPQLNLHLLHAHEIRSGADPLPFLEAHLGDPVYLTVDLDVFDPSIMPSTGTPEPGGLLWHEVDRILAWLFANRRVVAMDVVELAPIEKFSAPDFLAARLIYRAIGRRFFNNGK